MRLDPELRLVILEKVGIFSSHLSISEPQVLLTTKEVLEMPKELTAGRRTTAYKYYGVSYMLHNLVFINVKKIPDEKALDNTIAHELVHLRFPYLAHGRRFNKYVRQVLRGKTFPPYKKRTKR
jgi:predicted SprT family Zn-dependent metalloprotease